MRFFSLSRFAHEAGANVAPAWVTPSASGETAAWSFQAQSPAAFSTRVNSPALVAKRLFLNSVILPALTSANNVGQSRQKSGLTQGFCAMRRLCLSRNWLMADMREKSEGHHEIHQTH